MARPSTRTLFSATSALLALTVVAGSTAAGSDADELTLAAEGKKLVASAACEQCHASKIGGDGTAMYLRKDKKVSSKPKLLAQVARCSNELNLGLFPDDEAAIATYLNKTYYKFKD